MLPWFPSQLGSTPETAPDAWEHVAKRWEHVAKRREHGLSLTLSVPYGAGCT